VHSIENCNVQRRVHARLPELLSLRKGARGRWRRGSALNVQSGLWFFSYAMTGGEHVATLDAHARAQTIFHDLSGDLPAQQESHDAGRR
jgi:hypothetical protein